ncbi:MAG: peptidylprolyl isomerase [Chitinophagaceae bacterium]|nr:peptidylprolyl isomerase [Chitinophagaceae bacterium]
MRSFLFFVFATLLFIQTNAQVLKTDANLLKLKAPETFKAEFVTSKGNFIVEVYRNWSPLGADRFYQLIRSGYYNNTVVFRVIKDYLVQFGVSEDKQKNIFWQGKNLKDEPVVGSNTDSTLCFSRGAPNTRKTSVFINLRNNLTYDTINAGGVKGFVPFAKVIIGMDVVRQFFSEYGNDAMKPADSIYFKGNKWFINKFPQIDIIKEARILKD